MDATNANNNRNTDQQPAEELTNQFGWLWFGHSVVDLGALNQSQGWNAIQAASQECKETGKPVAIKFKNNWD